MSNNITVPNFFHKIGSKVLFRGTAAYVKNQKYNKHKNRKYYTLINRRGDTIKHKDRTWFKEYELMAYFDIQKTA